MSSRAHNRKCIFCKKNLSYCKSVLKLRKRVVAKAGIRPGTAIPVFYEFHRMCLRHAVFGKGASCMRYRKLLDGII